MELVIQVEIEKIIFCKIEAIFLIFEIIYEFGEIHLYKWFVEFAEFVFWFDFVENGLDLGCGGQFHFCFVFGGKFFFEDQRVSKIDVEYVFTESHIKIHVFPALGAVPADFAPFDFADGAIAAFDFIAFEVIIFAILFGKALFLECFSCQIIIWRLNGLKEMKFGFWIYFFKFTGVELVLTELVIAETLVADGFSTERAAFGTLHTFVRILRKINDLQKEAMSAFFAGVFEIGKQTSF